MWDFPFSIPFHFYHGTIMRTIYYSSMFLLKFIFLFKKMHEIFDFKTSYFKLNTWDEYSIIKLSFHINIKAHSKWHCADFGRRKYLKNISLYDFQELQLKNVIDFYFIYIEYIFLMITFKKSCARFFRNQIVFEILIFVD